MKKTTHMLYGDNIVLQLGIACVDQMKLYNLLRKDVHFDLKAIPYVYYVSSVYIQE